VVGGVGVNGLNNVLKTKLKCQFLSLLGSHGHDLKTGYQAFRIWIHATLDVVFMDVGRFFR
jgi:hypothetical protein